MSAIETRQVSIVNTHKVYNNVCYIMCKSKLEFRESDVLPGKTVPWQKVKQKGQNDP